MSLQHISHYNSADAFRQVKHVGTLVEVSGGVPAIVRLSFVCFWEISSVKGIEHHLVSSHFVFSPWGREEAGEGWTGCCKGFSNSEFCDLDLEHLRPQRVHQKVILRMEIMMVVWTPKKRRKQNSSRLLPQQTTTRIIFLSRKILTPLKVKSLKQHHPTGGMRSAIISSE